MLLAKLIAMFVFIISQTDKLRYLNVNVKYYVSNETNVPTI